MTSFVKLWHFRDFLLHERRNTGAELQSRDSAVEVAPQPSVLVVDDERNVRSSLADLLGAEGFSVATAATGERAVRMYGKHPYDVVLMDVRLPGIDGLEAARRMRRFGGNPRVIMMSAYAMGEIETACVREGALAFIRKPLSVREIGGLLERLKAAAGLV